MKRLCIIVLSLYSFCFISCNKFKFFSYGRQYNEYEDTSLAKVIVKDTLVVGIMDYAPPCAYLDSNGEVIGFDVDVFKEIASRLDIKVKFKVINWKNKEAILASGEVDCIASSFTYSKERSLSYSLTIPTLYNAQVVVTLKDSKIKNLEDLENTRIGYLNSSHISALFEDNPNINDEFKKIVSYPSFPLALEDLKLHSIDAVFIDLLIINYIMEKEPNDYRILNDALTSEKYVYAFRKNDKLLKKTVEKLMLELEYEGKILEFSKKWFGGDIYLFGR